MEQLRLTLACILGRMLMVIVVRFRNTMEDLKGSKELRV